MKKKSFIDTLRGVITKFVGRMNAVNDVIGKEKQALSIYNKVEQDKRIRELENDAAKIIEKARAQASEGIATALERARAFLSVAVVEIDPEEITKLEKIFAMGTPSEFEIKSLINTYSGSYWALRYISNKMNDDSVKGILSVEHLKPDVNLYLELFEEIEKSCSSFINSYDGASTLQGYDNSAATALILMSDAVWTGWRDRINSLCPALATDATIMDEALTKNDRKLLDTIMPSYISGKDAIKGRIRKYLGMDNEAGHYKSILLRSQFAALTEAVLADMELEELDTEVNSKDPMKKALAEIERMQEQWKKENQQLKW